MSFLCPKSAELKMNSQKNAKIFCILQDISVFMLRKKEEKVRVYAQKGHE